MIGLGITTVDRPGFFRQMSRSVIEHLTGWVDYLVVVNDGTRHDAQASYRAANASLAEAFSGTHYDNVVRTGYGPAKNQCLRRLLDVGCDWLFLADDDIEIRSRQAVTNYVEAMALTKVGHLSFHAPDTSLARGGLNTAPLVPYRYLTVWPNHSGQWLAYSRLALEQCGLFDEGFEGSWEHVEHTTRIGLAGLGYCGRGAYDATGSEEWIRELPGSPSASVSALNPEHDEAMKRYWAEHYSDSYEVVFGSIPQP